MSMTSESIVCTGCFVRLQGSALGLGKIISIDANAEIARVQWFRSVLSRLERDHPLSKLSRDYPRTDERCYVWDDLAEQWLHGRVLDRRTGNGNLGTEYWVRVAGTRNASTVDESKVFIRCSLPAEDPIACFMCDAQETPFFYQHRRKAMEALIRQRAASRGLSGLLSSSIKLFPHQIEIVRRVLEDHVQRYILADEVGLGKTIEAGVILRQSLLDDPDTSILIAVPDALVSQWKSELEHKFHLRSLKANCKVIPHEMLTGYSSNECRILVVDEAHRLVRTALSDESGNLWSVLCDIAHNSEKVFLLSATPALHNERDFLAMLHLLEPNTYTLNDLSAFEMRVRERQNIGEFLELFHEGLRRGELRYGLDLISSLFPHDEWIQGKSQALRDLYNAEDYDVESINSIVRLIRIHICETYRIHRRLLRSSRRLITDGFLIKRANDTDNPPITQEFGTDGRQAAVWVRIEEWRQSLAAAYWSTDEHDRNAYLAVLGRILKVFLECSGTWLEALRWAARSRLGECNAPDNAFDADTLRTLTATPLVPGERDILCALCDELDYEPEDGDSVDALTELVARMFGVGHQKLVVFTWSEAVGVEIIRRLQFKFGKSVYGHLSSECTGSRDEALAKFESADHPCVLVCDSSGEEGLNLQFADILIHFDLPWDPNRLEQRIGRFDRIGRATEVKSSVFAGTDSDDTLQDAWYDILRNGLGIFSGSVADLQFYLDGLMTDVRRIALLDGPESLRNLVSSIGNAVTSERRAIREQKALDEIEPWDKRDEDFIAQLLDSEDHWQAYGHATDQWMTKGLGFMRQAPISEEQAAAEIPTVMSYTESDYCMAEAAWQKRLIKAQPGYGTYNRDIACIEPNTHLLRIGHPFVDALYEYLRWDDRGQAYAIWRYIPGYKANSPQVYFRLDYVIETDLKPLRKFVKGHGLSSNVVKAFARKADGWFPPERRVVHLRHDASVVSSQQVIRLLSLPYRKDDPRWTDCSLDAARMYALDGFFASEHREAVYTNVRKRSETLIRSDQLVVEKCIVSADTAEAEKQQRLDQIRRGLDFEHTQGIDTRLEEDLYSQTIAGIKKPRVFPDSVGMIVLSSMNPFER